MVVIKEQLKAGLGSVKARFFGRGVEDVFNLRDALSNAFGRQGISTESFTGVPNSEPVKQ